MSTHIWKPAGFALFRGGLHWWIVVARDAVAAAFRGVSNASGTSPRANAYLQAVQQRGLSLMCDSLRARRGARQDWTRRRAHIRKPCGSSATDSPTSWRRTHSNRAAPRGLSTHIWKLGGLQSTEGRLCCRLSTNICKRRDGRNTRSQRISAIRRRIFVSHGVSVLAGQRHFLADPL